MLDIDTWIFFKWIFKTFVAVMILSNTWNIVMGVFELAQSVINGAAGLVQGSTEVTVDLMADFEETLKEMEIGPLLGLWIQSTFLHFTLKAIGFVIFVITYGRMVEIYMLTSIAPIPFATIVNRELGHTGQNYFKSLFAVGFQGLLIIVCVAIYAVLIQTIAIADNPINAVWLVVGYTVLLCYTLFKTGSLAKSVFGAH